MIARLAGALGVIIIGFSLMPAISTQVNAAMNTSTASSSMNTVAVFIPALFALGILIAGVAITVSALRSAGLLESFDDEDDDIETEVEEKLEKPKPVPHEQTYLEYVKERLSVERLLRRFG